MLSSGTNSELNASAQLGRGNVRIVVNGQREDNNNYLIEGISSTDYDVSDVSQSTNVPLPNPDVIQEFKVQTSLYVLVNKSGFSQSRADNIEVRVTETTRVSIALKPGEVAERVEISAQVTNVEYQCDDWGVVGCEQANDLQACNSRERL